MRLSPRRLLVILTEIREEYKADGARQSQEQVVLVQAFLLRIVREPPVAIAHPRRRRLEDRDQEGAEEASEAKDAEVERDADGPHGTGDLRVEELLHPDDREHVCYSQEDVLWEKPEDAQLRCISFAGETEPLRLNSCGDDHGYN